MKTSLSLGELKVALYYDPSTGVFTRLKSGGNNKYKAGDTAGSKTHYGYQTIMVNKVPYLSHRLAWLYVYGEWPLYFVDHINGVRDDNRIENLREATMQINIQNQKVARKDNLCGFLGVGKKGKKYSSRIRVNGIAKHLGHFKTPEEAHAAYLEAKRELHAGCTI